MPFSIRPFRRSPVQCSVIYNAGPFHGQGTAGLQVSTLKEDEQTDQTP